MESRSGAGVGLMVLIGLGLFAAAFAFLSHGLFGLGHYTVKAVFSDTKGLSRQTPVRMNGVTIGEVQSIDLSNDPAYRLKPVVTLAIDKKVKIPLDSDISITSGLLITTAQVEIKPGVSGSSIPPDSYWPQQHVREAGTMLAQVSPEADQAVKQLTITLKEMTPRLNRIAGHMEGILKRAEVAMENIQATTGSARSLIADPKIRQTMYASLDDLQASTREARRTASALGTDLRAVVRRNSGKVDELVNNAIDTLQKLGDTVDAARSAVTRLTEQVSDPRLQTSLLETLDTARATVARFNQIASDIHQLTGDPSLQNNIKETVVDLRETTAQAKELTGRISTLVGAIKPGGRSRLGIGQPQFAIDLLARANAPHFRSDINLRLPIGTNNAFDFGIYDFAERYKLNAQYETDIRGLGAFRYGIYASKLGVGLSLPAARGTRFRIDAYDPNKLQIDARGLFQLTNDFSLWVGADSIFKRTTPLIGVRLNR